jgi:hypothetical protein
VARLRGTRWEAFGEGFFVGEDEAFEEPVFSGDAVERFDVEFAELLDVDWPAVLRVGLFCFQYYGRWVV